MCLASRRNESILIFDIDDQNTNYVCASKALYLNPSLKNKVQRNGETSVFIIAYYALVAIADSVCLLQRLAFKLVEHRVQCLFQHLMMLAQSFFISSV